jgi:hypothetical protein
MASVLAIGVGVAAAAFLVRSRFPAIPRTFLTSLREEQAWLLYGGHAEKQSAHWGRLSTRADLSRR